MDRAGAQDFDLDLIDDWAVATTNSHQNCDVGAPLYISRCLSEESIGQFGKRNFAPKDWGTLQPLSACKSAKPHSRPFPQTRKPPLFGRTGWWAMRGSNLRSLSDVSTFRRFEGRGNSLYGMRETSQRPDRCAVVPLMGSRAVGSTVRL